MADTKISAATAVVTPASTDEYATNQGGASKKTTRAQMHSLESGELLLIDDGTEGAPGLGFATDPDTGIWQSAAGELNISVNGDEKLSISAGSGITFTPESTGEFVLYAGYTNRGKLTLSGGTGGTGAAIGTWGGGELSLENNGNHFWTTNLNEATGNEIGIQIQPTVNKATSGDVVVLDIVPTLTANPGKYTSLQMDQLTEDAPFINFKATIDADATSAISSLTTSGAVTHHIQIELNGTTAWIPCSTTDPT